MGIVVGIVGALAAAGVSASSAHQERKATKGAQERSEQKQALLAQQARDAEAQAQIDAKESIRLQIQERQRSNTWKTRDEEEDKLGVQKTALGR